MLSPRAIDDFLRTLRCMVCPNQSLADSAAPLAIDVRNAVTSKLSSGESIAQVKAFLVERYGAAILYDPPFEASTVLLWMTPVIAVGVMLYAVFKK